MTPKATIMKYSSRCDHCRRENWVCFDCAVSAIHAAVQAEREAKEKLRLVLHNSLCQEYDDCVEACIEARTAQDEGEGN